MANKDVTMLGDGSQLRSWCYIDDFCDAMMGCIEQEKAIGEDFNIGNPVTAVTIYDLAARTIRLAKSGSKITTTAHTFSDIGVRAPSSQKARELLGYVPKFDLDAGFADDRLVPPKTSTTSAIGSEKPRPATPLADVSKRRLRPADSVSSVQIRLFH